MHLDIVFQAHQSQLTVWCPIRAAKLHIRGCNMQLEKVRVHFLDFLHSLRDLDAMNSPEAVASNEIYRLGLSCDNMLWYKTRLMILTC